PSAARQHGSALMCFERVIITTSSFVHAGSVIVPRWLPAPVVDAAEKSTAPKSARDGDGPSAIHSAELRSAALEGCVTENVGCIPTVMWSVKVFPLADTSAATAAPGATPSGITTSLAGNISHHAK